VDTLAQLQRRSPVRRIFFLTFTGLCLMPLVAGLGLDASQLTGNDPRSGQPTQPVPAVRPQPTEATCGKFGTSVEFQSTPSDAARKAKQEQKLVFVLHVSGHFEDPQFT
jgi:hypothetical protein